MRLVDRLARTLARTGYEVRRSDAKRRGELFRHLGIDLVLDVGAGHGQYGAELRRFGYEGRIVSFEPLAGSFARLEQRIDTDPSWSAVRCAVGAEAGSSTLNVAGNASSSSLLPMLDRHEAAAPQTRYVADEVVEVRTLDSLALDDVTAAQSTLLKIDTQGYERFVLDGAVEVIGRLRAVQIELSFVPLYAGSMLFDEAVARLVGAGFELHGLEPGFRDPATQQLLQADGIFVRPTA